MVELQREYFLPLSRFIVWFTRPHCQLSRSSLRSVMDCSWRHGKPPFWGFVFFFSHSPSKFVAFIVTLSSFPFIWHFIVVCLKSCFCPIFQSSLKALISSLVITGLRYVALSVFWLIFYSISVLTQIINVAVQRYSLLSNPNKVTDINE